MMSPMNFEFDSNEKHSILLFPMSELQNEKSCSCSLYAAKRPAGPCARSCWKGVDVPRLTCLGGALRRKWHFAVGQCRTLRAEYSTIVFYSFFKMFFCKFNSCQLLCFRPTSTLYSKRDPFRGCRVLWVLTDLAIHCAEGILGFQASSFLIFFGPT